jgi:SAM-dependent methyltransferase
MPEGWEWDETLYLGSACYYQRGRLPYASALPNVLSEILGLDGRGRLIDVGCGPGILALSLAHLFRELVGVDADAAMVAEAERRASEAAVRHKIRWIRARAEDLPAGLGTFTTATFGQSFHWMDRDRVAGIMYELLQPGGAFVQISDLKGESLSVEDLPHPPPPYGVIRNLIRQYLGPARRAGQGVLSDGLPDDEAAVLARARFIGPMRQVVPGGPVLERTSDQLLAWVFSLSDSAPHLFGPHRNDFEADLARLLSSASPTGRFAERQPSTEIFVWHKPEKVCGPPPIAPLSI